MAFERADDDAGALGQPREAPRERSAPRLPATRHTDETAQRRRQHAGARLRAQLTAVEPDRQHDRLASGDGSVEQLQALLRREPGQPAATRDLQAALDATAHPALRAP